MNNTAGKIDLHMHTTVSDGTDTPEEITAKVKEAGITVFSVTDHDAIKAGKIIRRSLGEGDPRFVPGVEFSCRDKDGKYHILGYGFDPESTSLNQLVNRGKMLRMEKLLDRVGYLHEKFGIDLPEDEIFGLLAKSNPGKPHLANLMVKYGFAASFREAMDKYLERLPSAAEYITPEEAIVGILSGGGIPVLAHPVFGSGREKLDADEMKRRLIKFTAVGLEGIEAFYSGFPPAVSAWLVSLADQYNLLVTAGSDYHGTNKTVALGETGLPAPSEYPEALRRFLDRVGV